MPDEPVADVDLVLGTRGGVVATVDSRYQSYNIEMVEVTGGEFWKPYDAGPGKVVRPPLDLADERIRNLAAGLGPAYVRVSGLWANATYFDADFDADHSTGGVAPEGFDGVLTGEQWRGVGEFADAIDAQILVSFAASEGVRDAAGDWQPDQARALLEHSVQHDVPVVAVEFINEPGLIVGVVPDYDAARYERDFATFVDVVDEVMPDLQIIGPSATADMEPLVISPSITVDELMLASGSALDVFSYHYYPKVAERCGTDSSADEVLTEEYLSSYGRARDFYAEVRDRHTPGAPMWITETAQAACGGDRWAAHFQDSIRYIDTLGRLAQGDGDAVFHNTLAASDYALIDEDGLVPRPSYWAAVLWGRLMGPEVLAVQSAYPEIAGLNVYAHCSAEASGDERGTTYVVLNTSTTETRSVAVGNDDAVHYQLTSESLDSPSAMLNGTVLEAAPDGTLPPMDGAAVEGAVTIPPASVTYVVDPAPNASCN